MKATFFLALAALCAVVMAGETQIQQVNTGTPVNGHGVVNAAVANGVDANVLGSSQKNNYIKLKQEN